MEYKNVLVMLFFHVIITLSNSKFQHSVMKLVCEIGLQGCCFVDCVTLAFGALRWDTDGFLWNKASLLQLSIWLVFFFGSNSVFSDWAKLQLTSVKRLAWVHSSVASLFKVLTSQVSYACGGENCFHIGHWNKPMNCSQATQVKGPP